MTNAETTVERVGSYRIVRRLATGGTSDVLLAKSEGPLGFERTVVLKLLLSQFRKDEGLARMFAREASAYARLSHPAIVQLFDFFAVPDTAADVGRGGQLCMVLEHVDGPPLTRLRTMLRAVGKELDGGAAIFIATKIFEALAAAHSALDDTGLLSPVIHRDVSPGNVLVPWDGHVKLADFGVAKVAGLDHHSVAGMIKGTYGYMAPEQVTGEEVTPRADVYAAAVILWELLARRKAFQRGALPEIEALRAMAEPRLPLLETVRPDVDRTVLDAVKRALEPRAEHRTITAGEMVSILSAVVPAEEGRARLVRALDVVCSSSQIAVDGAKGGGGLGLANTLLAQPHTLDEMLRTQLSSGLMVSPPNGVRGLGEIPPAPAAMNAMPTEASATLREMGEAPTVAPPPDIGSPMPQGIPGLPLSQTVAMATRPVRPKVEVVQPSQGLAKQPSHPGARSRSAAHIVAAVAVLCLLLAGIGGAVAYVRHHESQVAASRPRPVSTITPASSASSGDASHSATASAETPLESVASSASAAPPTSAALAGGGAPAASGASPRRTEIAQGTGVVKTTGAPPGRRIFVDHRARGQTPDSVTVKCGRHSIRLGSTGRPQMVDVPCGGEVTVSSR